MINPPTGTSITRQASGGVPPYIYSTNDPAAVEVNPATGQVIGLRNRTARITVSDRAGSTASYQITIQNVWYIRNYGDGRSNWSTMVDVANRDGGHVPALAHWRALRGVYGGDPGGYVNTYYWSSDTHAWGSHWLLRPSDGVVYGENDNGKIACIGVLMPSN